MKKYKINVATKVNKQASKSGILWRYAGTVSDYESRLADWRSGKGFDFNYPGIRITDTETNQVIIEEMR